MKEKNKLVNSIYYQLLRFNFMIKWLLWLLNDYYLINSIYREKTTDLNTLKHLWIELLE